MKGKGEHFADARRKAADARRKARANKSGSTQKLAKNIRTVKKYTRKGSERAGMIKSLRQKQARKANQMHEG